MQRPAWLAHLGEEDFHFLRRFLLCSGSLKDLAAEYGVSYPTVRARLDRFIAKVRAAEDPRGADPLEQKFASSSPTGRCLLLWRRSCSRLTASP